MASVTLKGLAGPGGLSQGLRRGFEAYSEDAGRLSPGSCAGKATGAVVPWA